MKIQNAIKKLEKSGAVNETHDDYRFRFILNGEAITFSRNGRGSEEVTCIATCPLSMESERDSMTDYFPETFHDNITQAIKFVQR
ncbi:hypothetical protein P8629_08545 [Hydrogenovibrio sp. 3SP14C1]|uniref:hypothetical protein n=1 Tax=Hydrogenovibrio sp. 3SP14C1 TaxID=3038774 RepID=UPI002416EFAB|nr:hypothetical protein [Hydrogenovibrio sp. 3SP14C1]MDG4813055.1 hypothetical protein [Hydrogenovibrio sp. 3SP14C1]